MESVILAVPRALQTAFVSRIQATLAVTQFANSAVISIATDGTRAYIVEDSSIATDYDPEELCQISNHVADPVFYTIEFSDIGMCRKILLLIADDPAIIVDNDHGILLSGKEFVMRIRTKPDWDWRIGAESVPGIDD